MHKESGVDEGKVRVDVDRVDRGFDKGRVSGGVDG